MQNRYTGDIGDYVKYGLLRALSKGKHLGIAWYLFPDQVHNKDGRHIDYLSNPDRWASSDSHLFRLLKDIVNRNDRSVVAIETSGVLSNAVFSGEVLQSNIRFYKDRGAWRLEWFERILGELSDCNLVFADPDNGLCEDEKFRPTRRDDWKRIPLREALRLAENRTAIIYHHNTRRKGGHEAEIRYWATQLGSNTLALRWRAHSARTFFIINPTSEMPEKLQNFADRWGPKAEFLAF